MLHDIDLSKIRVLAEVARAESVGKAARALRVTPSAVSQNVKAVERSLGKQLFLRVGKRMKATELAKRIVEQSDRFFGELSTLLEGGVAGEEVRVGAPPLFGSSVLLDHLTSFFAARPRARILLHLLDTQRLLDDLVDAKLDCAFVDDGPHVKKYRELVFRSYWSERLVLCCATSFHKRHLARGISPKALGGLPHVPYHRGEEAIYKWYRHHFGKVPKFPFVFSVDHPQGVLGAVVKGWGVGVVPRSLLDGPLARREVVVIAGPKPDLKSEILLAQNKARVPSRAERELLHSLARNPG